MVSILHVLIQQILIVSIIGGVVAICAHFFVQGIKYFELLLASQNYFFELFGYSIDFLTPGLLTLAFFLIYLLRKFGNMSKWETPADIIFCAQNRHISVPPKNGLLTILASFISLAGGASLGQYGPLVHLGGTLGLLISKTKNNLNLSRDIIIGCAVAAAIAAGFSAPIAAIIFAHEAVLRHFSGRAIAMISISSITASAVNKLLFEPSDIFQEIQIFSIGEEMVFVSLIAGAVFGLSAIFIIKSLFLINKISSYSKKINHFVLIFGLIYLISLSQILPEALGLGTDVINVLFTERLSIEILFALLVGKFTAVLVSVAIGFSGGFVGPALFIGAAIGALLSSLAAYLGFYSLTVMLVVSGSAAVAGTVFGAPLAMVILVLELTNSYDLTIATMLSIVVASLVFHLFYGHSLFDLQLLGRGIDLSKGKVFLELESKKLADLAQKDYLAFLPDENGKRILDKMRKFKKTEAYCISEKGRLIGKILIFDVISNQKHSALELASSDCLKLFGHQSLNDAMKIAREFIGEALPVVEDKNNKLLGVVSEADLFDAYADETESIREIETA